MGSISQLFTSRSLFSRLNRLIVKAYKIALNLELAMRPRKHKANQATSHQLVQRHTVGNIERRVEAGPTSSAKSPADR
ncbi:unnamed protein product [Ceratitis capitata]|uniref:(Mediterranean fruit fly) hypothetical protein n=1 Tax=Ceratitis capitata TaxID=7213 RepID=A0A811V8F5_CERCA|nr:unnamed protein product [Ceratitis capitata]